MDDTAIAVLQRFHRSPHNPALLVARGAVEVTLGNLVTESFNKAMDPQTAWLLSEAVVGRDGGQASREFAIPQRGESPPDRRL